MKLTFDERSGSFGFHEWNLDTMEEFQTLLKKMIREGLQLASKEYPCDAHFPIEWIKSDGHRGPPPDDPSTIYVSLQLGERDDDDAGWTFTLADLIANTIELHEHGEGGPIAEEAKPMFESLSARLRQLAGVLDAALKRE
jgi:hypothetical protein